MQVVVIVTEAWDTLCFDHKPPSHKCVCVCACVCAGGDYCDRVMGHAVL